MSEWKRLLLVVLSWRLALLAAAAIVVSTIGFKFPYPRYRQLIEMGGGRPLVWSWGGFDGVHYLTIAEKGYVADYTQAFFPIFPYLIRWVTWVSGLSYLLSGLFVSHVCLFVAAVLFFRLMRFDLTRGESWGAIWTWLFFPTAFYLGAVYTESLFMALVLGSFLAARKRRWLAAGLLGAVASATRLVGVFLLPALLIEWYQSREKKLETNDRRFRRGREIFQILLVPVGLGLYMWFLECHFSDPLKFLHVQTEFGASRSARIVLLYQVFWRYLKMLVTVDLGSLLYLRVFQEFFWSILFLVLGIVAFRKTRVSYAVFAFLAYLAPTLTGTFSSLPRYVLVMFPAFMLLGGWLSRHKTARWVWYSVSTAGLIVNMALFLTGRFIA